MFLLHYLNSIPFVMVWLWAGGGPIVRFCKAQSESFSDCELAGVRCLVSAMTLDLGDPPPPPHAHFVFKWLGSFLPPSVMRATDCPTDLSSAMSRHSRGLVTRMHARSLANTLCPSARPGQSERRHLRVRLVFHPSSFSITEVRVCSG